MCYSVAYLEKKQSKLVERYKNLLPPGWKDTSGFKNSTDSFSLGYFINAFTHPGLPIITEEGIRIMEWGLIPFWVKDEEKAAKLRKGTLNAVGETVFIKPSFKGIVRSKRGILPVSGFFEWREYNGKKYPYFIRLKSSNLFSLACIFDSWTNKESGEIIESFSVITCPANPMMEVVHNRKKRMPVILAPHDEQDWIKTSINDDVIKGFIKPFDSEQMEAYTVSRFLNNARSRRNVPQALEQVTYPELPKLLF